MTTYLILAIVQMCSPNTHIKLQQCANWMVQCTAVLPREMQDDEKLEICVERMPEPLWPN